MHRNLPTARLRLRRVAGEDFADSLAMWSAPEVFRFIGGRPSSGEEVWGRLLRYAGLWPLLGFGYWIVRERDSDLFVGEVGLGDFRRDIAPGLAGVPEIGWALAPRAWGQGFAREAISAVVGWADDVRLLESMVCLIAPENIRSVRLAERFAFRVEREVVYKGSSSVLYRRNRA